MGPGFGFLKHRSDSKVQFYQESPEIPVGGRLRFFLDNWKKITNDQWVLSVIEEGYKLEFSCHPPQTGIKQTSVQRENLNILEAEVEDLLRKDAIEMVPLQEINCGFYSTFFLVPKKNGKMRPVINLRPLNKYLRKTHFKMDTLSKVLNLVKPKDWAISLDLSDAYLHVPIFLKHRKFLRFCVNKKCYQFKALCFGPTSAPRVFTKIVAVVAAHLREQNVRLASYLDDWLALNQIRIYLLQDRAKCLNLLTSLGFIVNIEKSSLEPSQTITYIGGLFHLDKGLVFPTPERVQKLLSAVGNLSKRNKATAKDFLHLLGLIASCLELIPNARLYMRPVQLHLLSFWKPSSMRLETEIPVTQHLRSHLKWLLDIANITKGRSLQQQQTAVTITTDASKTGYGGYIGNQFVQGTWSVAQKKLHINVLELEAVFLALKHFQSILRGQNVLVRSDSTTVVQYLNKQGGTRSPQMCYRTWDLWNWAIENQMHIKAAHILGRKNQLADQLSRNRVLPTEWTLNRTIVLKLFHLWGQPMIDLFASAENRQAPIFCSWSPHPQALALDALTISWDRMYAYVYPPLCLIPKVLQHMRLYKCQIILIAPQWPRRHWYTELLQFLVDCPRKLPVQKNLLHQPKSKINHPNPEVFNLTAWLLSTEISKRRAFLRRLENCSQPLGEMAHRRTTLASSRSSVAGVVQGKSYSASLTEVADFLSDLFAEGLQYRTIAGYRSMLSSVLSPINNIPVGQHPYIIRLLKGVFNSRPPKSKLLPEWDLQKVLNMLQKEPFEPISAASLKLITYKVVFLTAISTFRRCSDLQSLKIGEKNVSVQKKGLTFIRHGLSKQDRQTHYGTKVFVPAFPENKKLDPKRAFYFYLKKTESLRTKTDGSSEDRVFLAINEPHQAVTSQTISKWIVKTIRMAYNDSKMKVKGHSTRAIGPSWALYNGASVKSILEAADWKKESTFIQFYFRNVDVEVLKQ